MKNRQTSEQLTSIPGVGKSIAKDLWDIGITKGVGFKRTIAGVAI